MRFTSASCCIRRAVEGQPHTRPPPWRPVQLGGCIGWSLRFTRSGVYSEAAGGDTGGRGWLRPLLTQRPWQPEGPLKASRLSARSHERTAGGHGAAGGLLYRYRRRRRLPARLPRWQLRWRRCLQLPHPLVACPSRGPAGSHGVQVQCGSCLKIVNGKAEAPVPAAPCDACCLAVHARHCFLAQPRMAVHTAHHICLCDPHAPPKHCPTTATRPAVPAEYLDQLLLYKM